MNRWNWIVAASAVLCAAGAAFAGPTLALHAADADPTTEGFTFSNTGAALGAVGPLTGDGAQMFDAWFTDDEGTNSNLSYSIELSEAQTDAMATDGFRLVARMRSPTLSDDPDFGMTVQVEDGARQFLLRFGTSANGVPLVVLNGDPTFYVVPGVPGEYHNYELIDADADGDVDLFVDGTLRVSDFPGVPASRRLVAFGDTSTTPGSGGRAHWNLVLLETLGAAACVGDVNGDGFIGFTDLNAIVSVFNSACQGCPEDVNGDDFVGFTDLNIVVSAFNTECP